MSILLVTSNRLGDAILTTGAVPYLAGLYPGSKIVVACGPLPAPLFKAMPEVGEVWPLQKQPRGGHWFRLWRMAARIRWEHVVDLRGSLIAYALRTKRRTVWHTARELRHRVVQLGETLGADRPLAPHIVWRPQDEAEADRLLGSRRPILAIGPTANWSGKQWPAERFAALAAALIARGGALDAAQVLVAGAPTEANMARPVMTALPPEKTVCAFGWPLPVLAAAFARASLYVGNDSGLMHLAAAVGAPAVGLFGPSRDEHYAPWGKGNRVVRTPASYEDYLVDGSLDPERAKGLMSHLEIETVLAAIRGMAIQGMKE